MANEMSCFVFSGGSGVSGRDGRTRVSRRRVVMMGREMKVKPGPQYSGRPLGDDDKFPVAPPGDEELEEIKRKNTAQVDREEMESAEDPFEQAERRKRTTVIPDVSAERRSELRVSFAVGQDAVLEAMRSSDADGSFLEAMVANRHLINTAFLYNMTSKILKAESEMDDDGDYLRALRAKMIDAVSVMDKKAIEDAAAADERVREVVMAKNVQSAVASKAGNTADDVNSFWIVLHGAIAAWEMQAEEGKPSPYQEKVYEQLVGALTSFLSSEKVLVLLGDEFKFLTRVFAAEPDEKQTMLGDVDDDTLAKICGVCCRVERLKFSAYRGLLRKLYDVRNYSLKAKYGIVPSLQPERFSPIGIPVSTSFDQFIRQNENAMNSLESSSGPITAFGI